MNEHDKPAFAKALKAAFTVTNATIGPDGSELWWRLMQRYDLTPFQSAVMRFLETARFPPKPADIIEIIQAMDGRLGADEAWQIAQGAMDENTTVVMNDEIAEAWGISQSIYLDGDKTGARMAFRSAYDRIVAESRSKGIPVKWWPSLGHDPAGREAPLVRAVEQGRLTSGHVQALLPGVVVGGEILSLAEKFAQKKLIGGEE